MEHSNGSMEGYTSEFEPVKKVKVIVESEEENDFKAGDRSNEVWIKPKNEKKSPEDSKSFCGRLTVTTHSGQHMSDGTASSSEMSPGASSPSRSCTQCGATKTPLWRNGPCGPKSLCNACGIRYKKVGSTKRGSNTNSDAHESTGHQSGKSSAKSPKRKADNEGVHHRKSKIQARDNSNHNNSSNSNKREPVDEKPNNHMVYRQCPRVAVPRRVCTRRSLPAYNTPKWGSRSTRFNSTSFRKAQTKDEEEGAALLMALACGLVNA